MTGMASRRPRKHIKLTESHRVIILPNMQYLDAATPEEYVSNYARRRMPEIKVSEKR